MPGIYNFPDIIQGDTFRKRTVTIVSDGNPLDLTGAQIAMQLKSNHNSDVVHTFDITITDASNGILSIENWNADVEPYDYVYDLKITLNNGITLTYMAGKFPIKPSISEWA